MWNSIKDLPGANTFMPFIAAGLLWFGINLFIGPEVIAPRLAAKTYMPSCQQTLAKFKLADANQRKKAVQAQRQRQHNKQRMATNMLGGFAELYFGREFVERYKDDPLVEGIKRFSQKGIQLELPDIPISKTSKFNKLAESGYCGCVIAEQLGKRISTGLYSSTLRFWKPENIRQLELLSSHLIRSQQCNYTPQS